MRKEGLIRLKIDKIRIVFLTIFILNSLNASNLYSETKMTISTEKRWQIATVELEHICIWDCFFNNKILQNTKRKIYEYDPSNEMIISPSFYSKHQIIFAKNIIAENKGKLILVDFNSGEEKVIYDNLAIRSPVLSIDKKYLAFLLNSNDSKYKFLILHDFVSSNQMKIGNVDNIFGDGYNANISWLPDSQHIIYSSINGEIYSINIHSGKKSFLFKGYDPISSFDGHSILFRENRSKPYYAMIYNNIDKRVSKLKISRLYNAIWCSEDNSILVVRNISSIFRWNEWKKETILINTNNNEKMRLFKYEGFEFLDCY